MLNDKGRKIVKERVGQQMNSYDHYKNIKEEEGEEFDNRWGQMAQQLGLKSSAANNRIGYGGGAQMPLGGHSYGHHGPAIKYDDDRRGAYVDNHSRGSNQPVNFNRQASSEFGPT